MRRKATLQAMLRRRSETEVAVAVRSPAAQQPCACFTGDWANVQTNCRRETCNRCGGWRPIY